MHLARIPRRRYTVGRTPIEPLPRLSEHLGGPNIYIKRDDLLGLSAGGNKTRKLEFVMADALAQELVQQGRFAPDRNVLFIHTGGSPALYAYPDAVLASQSG